MRIAMKKGIIGGFAGGILLSVGVFGGMLLTGNVSLNTSSGLSAQVVRKIELLEKYVDTYYLEEVSSEAYADGLYKGLLESLGDNYAEYYTKEEYTALIESTSGRYCGIGAQVSQSYETGIITIIQPFEGSPAAEAGILPGDIIYKVSGEEVTGEDLNAVVAKMKGEEGTTVDLQIYRDNEYLDITVERREIEVPTVSYEMLDNSIGYIGVTAFDEVTAEQFRNALDDLEAQGEKGLIIDLRNNGGGRLDVCVDMLDRMLPEGTLVSTRTKAGTGEVFTSTAEESFDKPLVILMNGNSASASEVFMGAVRDYGAGKLVGTKSFGKGIVQSIFDLKDGTAVKFTTSEYFSPNGNNIHGTGFEPDVEVELDEELKTLISIPKEKDNQLQKAIEVLKEEL
jgi:carboxyl-terminal processing protease